MELRSNLIGAGLFQMAGDVSDSIIATGTGINNAISIVHGFSYIGTTPAGSGVKLSPDALMGDTQEVFNAGGNDLNVYPPAGEYFIGRTIGDPYVLPALGKMTFQKFLLHGWAFSDLTMAGGSALVGFIQSGAGAKSRTMQSKSRDIVSVFDNMTAAQITAVQAGNFSIDVTAPLQSAWANYATVAEVYMPAGGYLVSGTPFTFSTSTKGASLRGVPNQTIIENKAAASTPTLKFYGAQYWTVQGIVCIGKATFPNEGIKLIQDGSANRCAYGILRDIVCLTNGVGIHIQDTNSIWIDNYAYWPSGGYWGGTADALAKTNGILADGAAGVNGITMSRLNICANIETIANGGSAVCWNTTAQSSAVHVIDSELEMSNSHPYRSINFSNIVNCSVMRCFVENADMEFLKCIMGRLDANELGSSGTITIGDTTAGNGCSQFDVSSCAPLSITDDVHCTSMNYKNVNSANAWAANLGTPSTRIGCTDGIAGNLPDIISSAQVIQVTTVSGVAKTIITFPAQATALAWYQVTCDLAQGLQLNTANSFLAVGNAAISLHSNTSDGGGSTVISAAGLALQVTQTTGAGQTVTARLTRIWP